MSDVTPHDCNQDAAAWVLGALEPAEAEAFTRHLETCVVCRDEVAAFERVVDVLPVAVPQYKAPETLRARVRREVRHAAPATPPVKRAIMRWPAGGYRPGPWLAGAGALAAAAIVLALVLSSGGGTRLIQAAVTGPGTAQLRVSGGRGDLVVHGLAAPPAGDIYEVWLQRGNAAPSPTPTLFSVTSQGNAEIGVSGSLKGVSRVMVTPEHAGGSLVPTHAPVILARLD